MSPDQLVTAVRAALDTWERTALAANVKQDDPEWWVSEVKGTGGQHFTVRSKRDVRPIARVERLDGDGDEPAGILDGAAVAEHIALHDPAAVLRQVAAYREILAEHSVIWRHTLYYADDDEHEPELPVCETCVPRHSSFKSRADVPLWPCKTVRSLARGLGINPEEG